MGMARPKHFNRTLKVRVTEELYWMAYGRAKHDGQELSAWVRQALADRLNGKEKR